jgi:hypothetical protein
MYPAKKKTDKINLRVAKNVKTVKHSESLTVCKNNETQLEAWTYANNVLTRRTIFSSRSVYAALILAVSCHCFNLLQ